MSEWILRVRPTIKPVVYFWRCVSRLRWPSAPNFPGQSRFLKGCFGKNTGSSGTLKCPCFQPPVPVLYYLTSTRLNVQVISHFCTFSQRRQCCRKQSSGCEPDDIMKRWQPCNVQTPSMAAIIYALQLSTHYVWRHFEISRALSRGRNEASEYCRWWTMHGLVR